VIPVWYHEAAEEELLAAVGYLEGKAEGLGRRFLDEVRRAEDSDCHIPAVGAGDLTGCPEAETPKVPLLIDLLG